MFKNFNIILTCLFIGVGIFSFSKVISLYRDNKSLNQQIDVVFKPKIDKLEKDNAKIGQELAKVGKPLLAAEEENRVLKEELDSKRNDLRKAKALLEGKEQALAQVTNKYNDLNNENNLFKEKFDAMFIEFTEMKKTLSSADALKKAIQNLKSGAKKNKKIRIITPRTTKINKKVLQKQQNTSKDAEVYGNVGYLVKEGKSTYIPRLIIKVLNAE